MNAISQPPTWLDQNLYPFESNFLQLAAGQMHYIDEGRGDVILFVHGTPTWSFLYRNFIKHLSQHYRCIAMDHLGFGLSEKPESFVGTPQAHAQNLSEFIRKMNLRKVTLVVHDFGGPIGLAAGIKNAARIQQIVLMNSWLWATQDDPAIQKIDRIINSFLGKFLYLNLNFSPKVLLKKGFADPKKLVKHVHRHYLKPFPNRKSRKSLFAIAQSLVGSSAWYQEQWQNLDALAAKNWLILWGMKDAFITPQYLAKWKKRLPHATIHELDCGHFVQEEAHTAIAFMEQFLKQMRMVQ
ncbi:MAG: alpha/beta fold hydrolase [Flammeovirgaceae bacterium]